MAKRTTSAKPQPKKQAATKKMDDFDMMVLELDSICDVSFNKRHSLFLDRKPFEMRLCSVDSTNILAYIFREHATRDYEYLSQSSLMQELVSTGSYPMVKTFIKRYG